MSFSTELLDQAKRIEKETPQTRAKIASEILNFIHIPPEEKMVLELLLNDQIRHFILLSF